MVQTANGGTVVPARTRRRSLPAWRANFRHSKPRHASGVRRTGASPSFSGNSSRGSIFTLRLVVLGKAHQAGPVFRRIVKNAPDHGLALYRLGWLFKSLGDTAKAGILLEQVLARSPKILEAGITLTELFLESNMAYEALNVLEQVSNHHPAALTPWVLRVRILTAVGNTDMAAEIAEQLKQQRPDDPDILMLYAETERASGRVDAAKAQLLQMVGRVEFSRKAEAYELLGEIAQAQGGQQVRTSGGLLRARRSSRRLAGKTAISIGAVAVATGASAEAETHFSNIDEAADLNVLLAAATWGHQRSMAQAKFSRWARVATANTSLGTQVERILKDAGL